MMQYTSSLESNTTGGDSNTRSFGRRRQLRSQTILIRKHHTRILRLSFRIGWNSQHPGCLSLGFLWLDRELRKTSV